MQAISLYQTNDFSLQLAYGAVGFHYFLHFGAAISARIISGFPAMSKTSHRHSCGVFLHFVLSCDGPRLSKPYLYSIYIYIFVYRDDSKVVTQKPVQYHTGYTNLPKIKPNISKTTSFHPIKPTICQQSLTCNMPQQAKALES